MKYEEITLNECFVKYHTENIICECDADKKEIRFMEE